jgi:hypothetical protein
MMSARPLFYFYGVKRSATKATESINKFADASPCILLLVRGCKLTRTGNSLPEKVLEHASTVKKPSSDQMKHEGS